MRVEHFENPERSTVVRWRNNGALVEKRYADRVIAVPLRSATGVLAVERQGYPDNAVIYDADGSERVRLRNPDARDRDSSFVDVYYSGDELTVILGYAGGQTACVYDEDGRLLRSYETR